MGNMKDFLYLPPICSKYTEPVSHMDTLYVRFDLVKHACDWCAAPVEPKYWTFDKAKAVVCDNQVCKEKQQDKLNDMLADMVDKMVSGEIKI